MKPRERRRRPVPSYDVRKGIYILPNLFTSGGMFCGFYSIIFSIQGHFELAAWTIMVSHIFDALDGRIARMTKSTSRFGVEYDSLADLISFGIAPAVLVYQWALGDFGKWGLLAGFFYLAAGAVRLARFNVQAGTIENKRFIGLPIPIAADVVCTTILLFFYLERESNDIKPFLLLALIFALSLLMVSTFQYVSLKNLDFKQKQSVWWLFAILAVGAVAYAEPEVTLFSVFALYTLSGPVEGAVRFFMRRDLKRAEAPKAAEGKPFAVIEGARASEGARREAKD